MDVDWRFSLVVKRFLQRQFALLKAIDFVADQSRIDAILDGFDQLRDSPLRPLKLCTSDVERGIMLHAHLVEVTGILLTENLREVGIHQLAAQRAEDHVQQPSLADREPVRARTLIPARGAAILRSRDHRESAATATALQQE
ncbi:hypothetical protein [Hyphomonas sp.]|uniref:hypothetical protein n=1 Tax=Hyphomonas sp. TaxID=87 RepID=UPI0025C3ADDA|nr:hypothetical protein [Hyphomonas sp.]